MAATMKMINLYHKPCRNSGMGFLAPDIEHSMNVFHKYQCINCGKDNITSNDDDVIEEKVNIGDVPLISIKNKKTGQDLLVDGEFLVVFETEDQAKVFAEEMNCLSDCEYVKNKYIYGEKTNGYYLTEGDNEDGKSEEKK